MVAALVDLQVGAAGQRHLYLDQHFALFQLGDRHLLDFDVLFAVEDRRRHVVRSRYLSFHKLPG